MNIKKMAIFSFLSLLLLTGCGEKEKIDESIVAEKKVEVDTKSEKEVVTKHQSTPAFNFTSVQGKPITITTNKEGWKFEGLEDKVILLNFFGTWCPPCKAEIPHLNHIRSDLKKDFEILAVDIGLRSGGYNTQKELESFVKKFNIAYPIVSGDEARKLFSVVSELNPSESIPFMVLFNKKGQYVQYYIGMTPEEMLRNDISTTIKMK